MILFLFLQIEWQTVNKPYSDSLQELVVYFTIPNNKLKFIAEDSLFYANYESQLKVFNRQGNQVVGDYWRVKKPEDTLDVNDSVKILIPKTSSHFNLKIVDLYGSEIFNLTEKILPINYLGNIQWITLNDTLNVTFTLINPNGNVERIVVSIDGVEKTIPARVGSYNDSLFLPVKGFHIDTYTLKFEIFSKSHKIDEVVLPIKISKPFFLDEFTWSLKVTQLEYIATSSERNKLKNARATERDSLWREFWKQHDPTPNTEYNEKEVEYFVRIKYCEEHFSHGDRGWRSDRARIPIRFWSIYFDKPNWV